MLQVGSKWSNSHSHLLTDELGVKVGGMTLRPSIINEHDWLGVWVAASNRRRLIEYYILHVLHIIMGHLNPRYLCSCLQGLTSFMSFAGYRLTHMSVWCEGERKQVRLQSVSLVDVVGHWSAFLPNLHFEKLSLHVPVPFTSLPQSRALQNVPFHKIPNVPQVERLYSSNLSDSDNLYSAGIYRSSHH